MTQEQTKELYSVTNDVIFKKIFTEHIDLLTSFLCNILQIKPSDVTNINFVNTESTPLFVDGKLIRFDIPIFDSLRNILFCHPLKI